MEWNLDKLFDLATTTGASDVLFVPGAPPIIWVAGLMQRIDSPPLTGSAVEAVFQPLLNEQEQTALRRQGDLDFSIGRAGAGRFRINLHYQRGSLSAAVRHIPEDVPSFSDLKLPESILRLADLPNGLVLVTGGAGTGKSTTLAGMVEYMNEVYSYHIVTLEDPIEFMFTHKKSVIEQREIGRDSASFSSALRHVVRQRPDVILVGEMRDLETISAALTAAETGHLVLASLHTSSADETINRIIDVFPGSRQLQVRVQLSDCLRGVICQALFHDSSDGGQVPAVEILIATPAVRRAIRDRQTHLLRGMMETGQTHGMRLMDAAIAQLVWDGRVDKADALMRARDGQVLQRMIG